jgi:glycosyltransferase involved in cell wall biosynthesis
MDPDAQPRGPGESSAAPGKRDIGRVNITLFVPAGVEAGELPGEARVVHGRLRGHAWEQLELPGAAAGCDITLHLSGTAPVRGGPAALVVHDVLPLMHPQFFSRRFAAWYRAVLSRAIPRAAIVITVSESSRRAIRECFGDEVRIAVVPQGLEPFRSPASPADVARVRARWDLPGRFLLATGRGDPRKNLVFLEAVLRELRRRGDDAPLVITGTPSPRVHGRCPDPHGEEIRFTGHVTDAELRALYTVADALCFPSLVEGFGRPPFEAAACGTPSLVMARPDAVDETRLAGYVIAPDAVAWADAIERIRVDGAFGDAIVDQARSAAGGMSWDACARAVLAACRSAAGVMQPARSR